MKKISVVLIFILAFLFAPAVHAEVQNTLSDEILVQAKAQADLFLELKNALGLDWLDKYNAYLQNPASKPVPTWDTSISSLINKGYLSAAFPTDFAVSISGNEAQISRNISSQAVRDAVKIYIPSATVSGNTVKLLVQRPAQWVAYESALNGKVSRDGSDSPDVLPGAQLDFGSGASINFISNDGKILGVNSLTYKGEEADTRFVNAAGDNMTGDLTIKGNKAWHAGNDGSGSGLDADLLDGKDSTYFTDASNLASGIVPVARLRGTYSIDISGNAATATNANYATSAGNADTVDGKHASDFALSGHTHGQYVQKTGDTMTGNLTLQGISINIRRPDTSGGYARGMMFYSKDGSAVEAGIGMLGSGNNPPQALYMGFGISPWSSSAGLTVTPTDITFKNNKVWHAGNDGSGSGLDADKLDGYHHDAFVKKAGDTMTGTLVLPNLDVKTGGAIKFNSTTPAILSADGSGNLNLQANKVTVPSKMDVGGLKITDIYAQDVFGWKSSVDLSGSNVGIRVPDQNILLGFNDKGGITVVDTTNGAPLMELDRSGQLYVNRNKVWHAGNDGSGSGLDADLLDGLDSTDFLRAQALGGQVDLNNIKTAGVYVLGYWGDAMVSKNLPVNSEFTLLVVGHPRHFVSQLFFPVPTGRTSIIFVRSYYAWRGTWTDWHAINSDGTISPYIPGNNVICDLSADPIDISALLSARTQTSYKTTTDETGTYKMWKYKQTIGPSSDIFDIIRPQYMNVIKSRTGLNTIASIKVRFKVMPQVNGNILAAGAVVTRRQPNVAIRYIYAGYDFYNSIVEAIDMVGKTQNTASIDETGAVELVELYTMKSNYVYGDVNITAESVAKAEIVTVWGTR